MNDGKALTLGEWRRLYGDEEAKPRAVPRRLGSRPGDRTKLGPGPSPKGGRVRLPGPST